MGWDRLPLSVFEVDCDGSACGSGTAVGRHVHPPQDGRTALARVIVRESRRTGYEQAQGITRLVEDAGEL